MSNMPVHVNVIWDPTLGINMHTLWVPPLPPSPIPVPSFEIITTQMWTAGFLLGKNKFTTEVFHKGVFICIDDHDIGPLIPDITIPFVNAYYVIMWPFSGRKIAFTASTVKMETKPTSCAQIWPPLPMMTCGDPFTLPTSYPVANLFNTVTVGLTFEDFVMGWVKIAVSIAIDALFAFGPVAKFFKKLAGDAVKTIGQEILGQVLGKLGLSPSALAKKAVAALAGWAISAFGDNPTLKFTVGGGLIPEVGLQAGGDPNDVHGGEVHGIPVGGVTGNLPSGDRLDMLTD